MVERQHHTINGIRTGAYICGEGAPILLLHGWGANLETMLPLAQRFGRLGYECHAPDLPGFGQSDAPPEPWSVSQYTEWMLAYLEYMTLEQVNLIGHSFGGRISIVLGAEHPERVDKIVLVDSAGVRPKEPLRIKLYYFGRTVIFTMLKLPGLSRLEPTVREWFRQRFGSSDYNQAFKDPNAEVMVPTFKLVIGQDLLSYAARIQAPTLLIWGENDEETPLRDGKRLHDAIPDSGFVVLPGAGHYAYLEQPDYFVRIVMSLFRNE